jgi:PHD/YefM family antitoxin component YafN of YafNO toxin-antitoxin module
MVIPDFRARTAIEHVTRHRRPLVLTQHGRSAVVILDVNEYFASRRSKESVAIVR